MPTTRIKKHVCLFGTSANPPTGDGGHVGVVKSLMNMNLGSQQNQKKNFDEIHVLPVYRHPFQSKWTQLIDYNHRVEMCQLAFSGLNTTEMMTSTSDFEEMEEKKEEPSSKKAKATTAPKVVVSRAEEDSFHRIYSSLKPENIPEEEKASLRVGTADLLEMLIEQSQNSEMSGTETEFSFCLGADTFMDLTNWKWKRSKDVIQLLNGRLIVINRRIELERTDQEKTPTIAQQENRGDKDSSAPAEDSSSSLATSGASILSDASLRQRIDSINATLANGNIVLLDIIPSAVKNVSSSTARHHSFNNSTDELRRIVPSNVANYIIRHGLYGYHDVDARADAASPSANVNKVQ